MNKIITLILIIISFYMKQPDINEQQISSSFISSINSSSNELSSSNIDINKTSYLDFYFLDVTNPNEIILEDNLSYSIDNENAKIIENKLLPVKDGTTTLKINYLNEVKEINLTIENKKIKSSIQNGLKINYNFIDKSYKMGGKMDPSLIVIHNTANSASAKNEVNYLHSKNNTSSTSYHFAVDENEIYQAIPLNISAYHAGNKTINQKSIGIEIARSTHSNLKIRDQAIDNSITLVTMLRQKYDLKIDDVITHKDASNKHCPHDIIDRYSLDKYYYELNKKEPIK